MTNNNGWPGKPGVPLNPERDGWHWLGKAVWFWSANTRWWITTTGQWQTSEEIGFAYTTPPYLGPCLTPAEVDARIATARKDALEEAARVAEELIKNAYNTGFGEGMREHNSLRGGIPWHDSGTKKARRRRHPRAER